MREFVFLILIGAVVLFSAFKTKQDGKDYGQCLQKVNKKFGAETLSCPASTKPYKVWFVNTCNDTLAVKLAVQKNQNAGALLQEHSFCRETPYQAMPAQALENIFITQSNTKTTLWTCLLTKLLTAVIRSSCFFCFP